jgi:hypothetical protein
MTFDARTVFLEEFEKALLSEQASSGFAVDDWFGAGRGTPAKDIAAWLTRGPDCVQAFTDWYEASGVKIWVTPDGQLALELALMADFGGVPVHVRPDIVLDMGGALVVTDLKSGATAPASMRQLGIYASGIEQVYGIRPKYGAWFMARGTGPRGTPPEELTYFQRPVPLDAVKYSLPYLTRQIQMFVRAREQGIFIANPGEECRRCGVAHACLETGGTTERAIDRR